jgi:hypothetical protein
VEYTRPVLTFTGKALTSILSSETVVVLRHWMGGEKPFRGFLASGVSGCGLLEVPRDGAGKRRDTKAVSTETNKEQTA